MGDGPVGGVTHAERRELDELRQRAFGADADIFDDTVALARLRELEERLRIERLAAERGDESVDDPLVIAHADSREPEPGGSPAAVATRIAPASTLTSRWRLGLVAGVLTATALLGAVAWSGSRSVPSAGLAGGTHPAPTLAARPEVDYQRFLNAQRDDVLSLPGSADVAKRMIRDQLRPYGTLYGRIVGVGPTVDHDICMIIADLPASSITCISVENAYALPVSVILPAMYSSADGRLPIGLISYTLLPGGSVVVAPAGSSASIGTPNEADSAPPD